MSSSNKRITKPFGAKIEIDEATDTDQDLNNEVSDDEVKTILTRLCKLESEHVKDDMNNFLSRVEKDGIESKKMHLKLFASLHCAESLSGLYMSPLKENQELGSYLIKQFVVSTGSDKSMFRWKLGPHVLPSLIQFCTRLRENGLQDPLYCVCKKSVTLQFYVLESDIESLCELQRFVEWKDLFPFVIEIGNKVLDQIDKALESSSLVDIVRFESDDTFSSFVRFVVNGIMKSADLKDPIQMPDGAMKYPYYEQLLSLYRLFNQLISKMDLSLSRIDLYVSVQQDCRKRLDGNGLQYLDVLNSLSKISKIYQGAGESIRMMLERRKATFCFFVDSYVDYELITSDEEEYTWIFEHKELLSFECRWQMAEMILSPVDEDEDGTNLEMLVDRSNLFADSCEYIIQADAASLKDGLSIRFKNESAAGPGVSREWFILICKEIFDTQHALFITSENDHRRFHINPASSVQHKHLDYFRFCGRVLALALLYQVQLGIALDRVLFKQLAGLDIRLEDIKDSDPTFYESCKIILDMDPGLVDSDVLGLTFSFETEELGSKRVAVLKPGGESLKVNSLNREDYIEKLIHYRFCILTLNQVVHLSKGFQDMLYEPELSLHLFFRCIIHEDLDRVLRGSESDISVKEWKAHTDCLQFVDSSREIVWLWKIIEKMPREKRRSLLFFWTAVSYLPFQGFSGLPSRLQICRASGTPDHLPTSHTCFYQLFMPRYPTYKIMQQRIAVIVQEHVTYSFG